LRLVASRPVVPTVFFMVGNEGVIYEGGNGP